MVLWLIAIGDRSTASWDSDNVPGRRSDHLSAAPSFHRIADELGWPGSFFQGPKRACSIREATSADHHFKLSENTPFPHDEGDQILPQDVKDAAAFLATGFSFCEICASSGDKTWELPEMAATVQPEMNAIRVKPPEDQAEAKGKLHTPHPSELHGTPATGGRHWAIQLINGRPIAG